MPFDRPTPLEIIDRIASDLESELGIQVRRRMSGITARAQAGAVHELYGFLEFLSLQLFPDTAIRPFLLRQAAFWGITPTPATKAFGTVTASGVDASVIIVGTILVRPEDSARFTVTLEAVIAGGTATVKCEAVDAGVAGNTAKNKTLNLESPIAGVDTATTVDAGGGDGIDGGNDEEGTEALRKRFSLRLSTEAAGGTEDDYIRWSLEVPGVTRAWVFRHESGLGTLTVRFVRDGDLDIFPSPSEVATVQAHLQTRRPTTAEVTTAAPIELAVAFTFTTLDPNDTPTHDAINASLVDLFAREAEPGDGLGKGTITLSKIRTAIGNSGVEDYTLTDPVADVVPALGELATVGVITNP